MVTSDYSSQPTSGDRVALSPLVSWHDAGGELALFHLETKNYFGLNAVASEIWRHLANHLTVAEIVVRLAEQYDAAPATITVEVQRVIAELGQADLLIPPTSPEAAHL
ncbi:MAG: PqqD family protein [Proteobacteria bacterium]|nr:PqqD family protein [Pseudomonadota bacterium]